MDRRKSGTAIHAGRGDAYGMPLGAVVTAANVNDSTQTQAVLEALVVKPPAAETPVKQPDRRDLAHSRADGAYGNRPSKERRRYRGLPDGGAQTRQNPAAGSRQDPLRGGALSCVPVSVRSASAALGPNREAVSRLGPTRRLCYLHPARCQWFCPLALSGEAYVRQAHWKDAAGDFVKLAELEPQDAFTALQTAALLLANEDRVGYRRLCDQVL